MTRSYYTKAITGFLQDNEGEVVAGKADYMSPEQADFQITDKRSDLFSVGTVLYLMVTRSRPFEGPSDLETLLRVQKGDFRPPEETAPDLPPEVAAVVARAMRKEPAERYASVDELRRAVQECVRHRSSWALLDEAGRCARALTASMHDVLNRLEKTRFEASTASFEDLFPLLLLPGVALVALDALLRAWLMRRFP